MRKFLITMIFGAFFSLMLNAGDYFLQVKHSGQYLNILNASKDNGGTACQGVNNSTDNFLWEFVPAGGEYFYLKAKHSGQFLNILNASKDNGGTACQGANNSTDNFLWKIIKK